MKHNKTILISILLILSISMSIFINNEFNPTKQYKKGSNTILIYMCGSSLESKNGAATRNINEMLNADIPENTTVVIQTGGTQKWHDFDIPNDKLSRYVIKNKKLTLVESNEIENMGNAKTLSSFLEFGVKNYCAENMSLIFWNHGGGSAVGVCMDSLYGNDYLTLSEIDNALKSLNLLRKFSFIGFDACLMANYKTACVIAPYANNMIASEELEPTSGWDYSSLLSNPNDLNKILDEYAEKHTNNNSYTISLVDLTKIDKIKAVLSEIIVKASTEEECLIARAAYHSQHFGSNSDEKTKSDLYDLGGIAEYLGIDYDFSDCISYRNGSARNKATGLSLYFPLYSHSNLNNYIDGLCDPEYVSFLKNYFKSSNINKVSFINKGEAKDNKLSFTISPDCVNTICSVQYTLYRSDIEGLLSGNYDFSGLGHDTDIIENDNNFTVNFVGNWVFFNGYQLNCKVVGESANFTQYSSKIKINGQLSNLLFVFDKNTRKISLSGYTAFNEDNDRITELKDGDVITMMYDKFSSDMTSRNYIHGETFTYSKNETPLTIKKLPDGLYVYQAILMDIYGNEYVSNFAIINMKDEVLQMVNVVDYNENIDNG